MSAGRRTVVGMDETATLTLSDFLLARIADDEALINLASTGGVVRADLDMMTMAPEVFRGMGMTKRLLAECEAKRRIVEEHEFEDLLGTPVCSRCGDPRMDSATIWPCATLRALALPYVDHPDYPA